VVVAVVGVEVEVVGVEDAVFGSTNEDSGGNEGVEVAVVGVEVEVVGVEDAVFGSTNGGVEVEIEVSIGGVEVAVVGVEVEVVGVEDAVFGSTNGGVEVPVIGVEVPVIGVEVATIGVEVAVAGVEVAVDSGRISSVLSGIIVDPRCLLSHSATAVTPSCHDSYVRVLPSSVLPTLPGLRVFTATPTVPNRESCSIIAIINRTSTV